MKQYQTEAILLAVRNLGDADRMVTLFSREYGKIKAMAYGARSARSALSGSVQPFAHVELSLTEGRGMSTIKQCSVKNSFHAVREQLTALSYASFIAEMAGEFWPECQPEPALFDLLYKTFSLICVRNPRIVTLAAAWQMLALAGYGPEYNRCVACGQAIIWPAAFDIQAGGSVCRQCEKGDALPLTQGTCEFIGRLLNLDWDNPGHFSVIGSVLMETEKILAGFLLSRLEKPLKTMAFLQRVSV